MAKEKLEIRWPLFLLTLLYMAGLGLFYYRYVPLVYSYQIPLVIILSFVLLSTIWKVEWGLLAFTFFFPLINNLPYFFGIDWSIPHAPTALVLFLFFFLGWLVHNSFRASEFQFRHPLFRPLLFLSSIIFISGVVTFLRYANFFPLLSSRINELIVNDNLVRAGGALMSTVFSSLNYLAGFLFFFILVQGLKSCEKIKRIFFVLSVSIFFSLLFSLVQKFFSVNLGNTAYWTGLNQINGTFTDPNSFGACLSAIFPVFVVMFYSGRAYLRVFYGTSIILTLVAFPSTGSRSAFLALLMSIIILAFLMARNLKIPLKKRFLYAGTAILLVTLISLSVVTFLKRPSLFNRLGWSLRVFSNHSILPEVMTGKLELWKVASKMVKDFPLSGVGPGAFIIELPNYGSQLGLKLFKTYTDSAENYFLQIGSELGLVGLFLSLWMFLIIIQQIKRAQKCLDLRGKDRLVLLAASLGLFSLFINYLFHSYIGSFEVNVFFWILVAIISAWPQHQAIPAPSRPRYFKRAALILAIVFGSIHLSNSLGPLSIRARTKTFGWSQDFGFYQLEKDPRGFSFRWAKKNAGITIRKMGDVLVIPLLASHPDKEKNPVIVKVFLADLRFRKKKLIQELFLKSTTWTNFTYSLADLGGEDIYLLFETNRDWQPLKFLNVPDPRNLAIALGEEWFQYPDHLNVEKIQKTARFPSSLWEGKYGAVITSNGSSQMKFKADGESPVLRLWVSGTKVLDTGPLILVRLNDRIIGKTVLSEDGWIPLVFSPKISGGDHILSVEFMNDLQNQQLGQERNLFLGDLEVIYLMAGPMN